MHEGFVARALNRQGRCTLIADPPTAPQPHHNGSIAAAISTTVVGLWRDYTGRGPTHARTTVVTDMIVVTLRDSLTTSERVLVRRGLESEMLAMRRVVQNAMREDLIAAVEGLTGRTVEAILADSGLDPDVAVVTFLMLPSPGDTAVASSA